MMNLHKVSDLDVSGKRVLVRLDLDLAKGDDSRLRAAKETLLYLLEKGAKIIAIGHKGRPNGVEDPNLSLRDVVENLSAITGKKAVFHPTLEAVPDSEVVLLENLRFYKGEEENDIEFTKKLAALGEVYINEAFAVSHRKHTSIVGLPTLLPHAGGFRLVEEVKKLSMALENPKRPVIALISGIKKDKLEMIKALSKKFDKILVGGRLPEYLGDEALESVRLKPKNEKLVIGNLIQDKEDITLNTVQRFKDEIQKAGTIILAGVLGRYEDAGHMQGTREVFEAIAASSAFKIAGGGDTEAAISTLKLKEKFDWISVGGGAMLEFLSSGTLPGIEALKT
ncbi:phosphoglycerate kinase [Candidatus Woesebacteria bacterium]|nr:phosphoglycerate kinase [Candidatus Woesebacteria bacterium]